MSDDPTDRGHAEPHHFIRGGRFVCTAPPTARCRNYPACECEEWTEEDHGKPPAPGHEGVPQAECWLEPWLNMSADLGDTYDSPDGLDYEGSGYVFPDGQIETKWPGDYVTWSYVDQTLLPTPRDDDE